MKMLTFFPHSKVKHPVGVNAAIRPIEWNWSEQNRIDTSLRVRAQTRVDFFLFYGTEKDHFILGVNRRNIKISELKIGPWNALMNGARKQYGLLVFERELMFCCSLFFIPRRSSSANQKKKNMFN